MPTLCRAMSRPPIDAGACHTGKKPLPSWRREPNIQVCLSLDAGAERRCRVGIERPAGAGRRREIVDEAAGEPLCARPGDHGGIVGAEIERRQDQR